MYNVSTLTQFLFKKIETSIISLFRCYTDLLHMLRSVRKNLENYLLKASKGPV